MHGQSVTGNGANVTDIVFKIKKTGTITGNAVVRIYAHAGTFGVSSVGTGAVLATSDNFDVSTLSTSFQDITFHFTGAQQITLTNTTKYVIVIYYTGCSVGNTLDMAYAGSGAHNGCVVYYDGGWAYFVNDDKYFYIYSGAMGVPTSSDDVFVDTNSGFGAGGDINETGTVVCHNITMSTGHAVVIHYVDSDIKIYGSAVFEAGTEFSSVNGSWCLLYGTGNETIDFAGANMCFIGFRGSGTYTLQSDVVCTDSFEIRGGTFNANNKNITALGFEFEAYSGNCTINMGSGTWDVNGSYGFWMGNLNYTLTINANTSLLKFSSNSGKDFTISQATTFYNFEMTAAAGSLAVYGNTSTVTFNQFKMPADSTIYVLPGKTIVAADFVLPTVEIDSDQIAADLFSGTSAGGINLYNGSLVGAGQGFLTTVGNYPISMALSLKKFGAPTGNAVMKIYAHTGTFGTNGKPTGAAVLVSSSTLDVSALTTSYSWQYFSFSPTVPLSDNTYYFAVLEYSGGDASNYVIVDYGTGDAGNAATLTGSTWTEDAAKDVRYYFYMKGKHTLSQASGIVENKNSLYGIGYSQATGGARFKAPGSVDNGFNSGWGFGLVKDVIGAGMIPTIRP